MTALSTHRPPTSTLRRVLFIAVLLSLLAPALPAVAGKIFLNGVDISGVRNQTIEKATVVFDENGDMHITAEGYAVQKVPPAGDAAAAPAPAPAPAPAATSATASPAKLPPPAPGAALTKRYWLVGQPKGGDAQYEVDVFVNSKWIAKLRSEEDQFVKDISAALRKGDNKVRLMAHKVKGERKSIDPKVLFEVIVGEGDAGGNTVMIDKPLVTWTRNAAELKDFQNEFTVTAR